MSEQVKTSTFKSLDKKTKFWYIFLSIITLGIFYLYIKSKIKKLKANNNQNNLNDKKPVNKSKCNIDINNLIKSLGNETNIEKVDSTLSSLKVMVKDKTKVDTNAIKQLGAKGIMMSDNNISIVFGDQTSSICELLKQTLGI